MTLLICLGKRNFSQNVICNVDIPFSTNDRWRELISNNIFSIENYSLEEKFAILCYGLGQNHSFQDGNKRIAVHILIVGLEINGIKIDYTQTDLINLGLSIAKGNCDKDCILAWIEEHKKKQ